MIKTLAILLAAFAVGFTYEVQAQAARGPAVTVIERRVDAANAEAFMRRMAMAGDTDELVALQLTFGPGRDGYSTFFAQRFGTFELLTPAGTLVFDQGPDYSSNAVVGVFRIAHGAPSPTGELQMTAVPVPLADIAPDGRPNLVPDTCPDPASC